MVVLATKVYVDGEARGRAMDSLESLVDDALADLEVEFTVGLRDDGFPSVTVTGADAAAARNLLANGWGTVTPHREADETHVGTLESWDDEGFVLDAGESVRVPADEQVSVGGRPPRSASGSASSSTSRCGSASAKRNRRDWPTTSGTASTSGPGGPTG